nr:MAG: iron ABC transporter substrate-binding protein [Bacillota bacterium]
MRKRTLALALAVCLLILAGCGSAKPSSTSPGSTDSGSSEPKKLVIYAGMMEDHVKGAVAEFEAQTGIKVEWVRMSSGETLTRIRAEKENPKASVWYGGPADAFVAAAEEGLLEPYISPNAAKIPDQFKDPNGYWTGIYVGLLGFGYNTKLMEEMGLTPPESWEDLLKPEFKGQIAVANPGSSGTSYTMLATIVQLMGEEEGIEYMKKLHEQVAQYPKSGTAPGQMAGRGEVLIGISFAHDIVKYAKEGMPLAVTFPKEGTGYEIGAVALIKGAPDEEAAKIFIDWALTKEAQELGQKYGSYQSLTNVEAQNPPEAFSLDQVKIIDYDLQWAGSNRTRLVEKWAKAVNMQ